MAHDLESLRNKARRGRRGEPFQHLPENLENLAKELLAAYLDRAHARYGPVLRSWVKAGCFAAASRIAQHGNPPNVWALGMTPAAGTSGMGAAGVLDASHAPGTICTSLGDRDQDRAARVGAGIALATIGATRGGAWLCDNRSVAQTWK